MRTLGPSGYPDRPLRFSGNVAAPGGGPCGSLDEPGRFVPQVLTYSVRGPAWEAIDSLIVADIRADAACAGPDYPNAGSASKADHQNIALLGRGMAAKRDWLLPPGPACDSWCR